MPLNPSVLTTYFNLLGIDWYGFTPNLYGPQVPTRKQNMVKHLHSLRDQVKPHKWIIGGNFNIITSLREEKMVEIT